MPSIMIGVPASSQGLRRPKRVRERSLASPIRGSVTTSVMRASMSIVDTAASDTPSTPE
jgi:hypothetical protein